MTKVKLNDNSKVFAENNQIQILSEMKERDENQTTNKIKTNYNNNNNKILVNECTIAKDHHKMAKICSFLFTFVKQSTKV